MKYNGFYVKISPDTDLHREDKDGNDVRCNGFTGHAPRERVS